MVKNNQILRINLYFSIVKQKDTVDAAWGDPELKNLQVSKSLTTQPTNHNMDSGWNDHPTSAELSAMDAGWDTTNINVEQPIMEEPLLNPITHHSLFSQYFFL